MTESDGGLPEGGSAGKDLFRLPKGCLRSPRRKTPWSCPGVPGLRQPKLLQTLRKLKGNQPIPKKPTVHLVHLDEEDTSGNEDQESDNLGGNEGVMEEFMVCLARAVINAQADEKCCYHCSSPEHFIHNCLLINTSREKRQLNGKEGTALKKGAWTPLTTANALKSPETEVLEV